MPPESPVPQPELQTPLLAPPRLHWGWVFLLGVVTFGLFFVIWLIIQANWAQKVLPRPSKALPFSVGLSIAWVLLEGANITMHVISGGPLQGMMALAYLLTLLIYFILYVIASFTLRSELQAQPIGIPLSPVMTFFFSSIYFQYNLMDYGLSREEQLAFSQLHALNPPVDSSIAPPVDPFAQKQQASAPAPSPSSPLSQAPTPAFTSTVSRYSDLETHELWQLLDDMEDERGKARRREAFYISTIIYLFLAWFAFYGPHLLWHQPHMINPADALKERNLTYLDLPPDALKQIKPKAPAILSDKDRVAASPDRKTLQRLQKEEPPPPPQQPPADQSALPPTPQPQQPQLRPQQPDQSILEAPKPQTQQQQPNFNQPSQSAGDNLRQQAENALHTRSTYAPPPSAAARGLQAPIQVMSDTTGVDEDALTRWVNQKFSPPVYENWIPLIPEEARPPLNKQGTITIDITFAPDGRVIDMKLVDSTHDDALNRAAWGSIKASGQFPPPPKGMKDPNLRLRVTYLYNKPLQ